MKNASPALIAYTANLSEIPQDWAGYVVDLYTFTLVSGVILRWCSADQPIKVGGHTFLALTPSALGVPTITRSRVNSTIGLSVDDLTITINATPLVVVGSSLLLAALQQGQFDGAGVLVERLIMPTWGDVSLGTFVVFAGFVGDVRDVGTVSATIMVKSMTELLNIQMPKNLFQPACRHILFDAGCQLVKSAFAVNGTVQAGATVISIPTDLTQPGPIAPPVAAPTLSQFTQSGVNQLASTFYVAVTYVGIGESSVSPTAALAVSQNNSLRVVSPPPATGALAYNVYVGLQANALQLQNPIPINIGTNWSEPAAGLVQGIPPGFFGASGWFTQGVINFTSGQNSGLSRFVIAYFAGGMVQIIDALPFAPANGDTFTIYPGCDKSMTTCNQKFANLINFGGEPFIPVPESAV